MTTDAMNLFGWPGTRLAARLRKHHAEIPKLTVYPQALVKIAQIGIRVFACFGTAYLRGLAIE